MRDVHIIFSTHIANYLREILASVGNQTVFPATLSVTCDVDDPDIENIVRDFVKDYNIKVFYTARESHGIMRAAQVRNNAVRTLQKFGVTDGLLIFLDGDIFLPPNFVELYQALGDDATLFHGDRIMLSKEETAFLTRQPEQNRYFPISRNDKRFLSLLELEKKQRTYWLLRKFKLVKPNKPTIINAHCGFSYDLYTSINGSDEQYEGYGCEDDDLARRAHKAGAVSCFVTSEILVYHMYHESRGAAKWRDNPGTQRYLNEPWPVYCKFGLDNPLPQNELKQLVISK